MLAACLILGTACKSPLVPRRNLWPMPARPPAKSSSIESEAISQLPRGKSQGPTNLPPDTPMATIAPGPAAQSDSEEYISTETATTLDILPVTTPADLAFPVSATEAIGRDTLKTIPKAKLVIEGVRPGRGAVKMAIYTTANAFPNPAGASQTFELPATASTIETTLSSTGRFAVGVYQDINSDGELNRNRFGIPTEPFAFSNDAIGQRGPPSFDQAVVFYPAEVAAGDNAPLTVLIKLP